MTMPEDQSSPPSDRPILAFFDVDNTLMRGTSLFQLGREAWNKKVITWRDIAPFAWHQMRFIRKGENLGHLKSAREKAQLVAAHPKTPGASGCTPDSADHVVPVSVVERVPRFLLRQLQFAHGRKLRPRSRTSPTARRAVTS